ncbi:hypothetical protein D3C78_1448810 [compost metagenome]
MEVFPVADVAAEEAEALSPYCLACSLKILNYYWLSLSLEEPSISLKEDVREVVVILPISPRKY